MYFSRWWSVSKTVSTRTNCHRPGLRGRMVCSTLPLTSLRGYAHGRRIKPEIQILVYQKRELDMIRSTDQPDKQRLNVCIGSNGQVCPYNNRDPRILPGTSAFRPSDRHSQSHPAMWYLHRGSEERSPKVVLAQLYPDHIIEPCSAVS